MAKSGFLNYLKEIIHDMVDSNGNIRPIPVGVTGRRNLPDNRIKLLSDLIRLLRDTDIISDETKIYINNKYITMRGVNEEINNKMKGKEKRHLKTTISRIQYDQLKLEKIFGSDFFVNVLVKGNDISIYEKIIAEQYMKYSKKEDLRKNLIINIPKNCMNTELSDEEFEEFVSVIAPYVKRHVKFIESNLSEEWCGYFNYLMYMPNLKGKDKERFERLKTLLSD